MAIHRPPRGSKIVRARSTCSVASSSSSESFYESSDTQDQASRDAVKVFPRRKLINPSSMQVSVGPVHVSREALEELFELPLRTAAEKLGICITAIKRICRKFGIDKWPYRVPTKNAQECRDYQQASGARSSEDRLTNPTRCTEAVPCILPDSAPPCLSLTSSSDQVDDQLCEHRTIRQSLAGMDIPASKVYETHHRSTRTVGPTAPGTAKLHASQHADSCMRPPTLPDAWAASNQGLPFFRWSSTPHSPSCTSDSDGSFSTAPDEGLEQCFEEVLMAEQSLAANVPCQGNSPSVADDHTMCHTPQNAQINIKADSQEAFSNSMEDKGLTSLHADWLVAPVDVQNNMEVQTIFCNEDWNITHNEDACFPSDTSTCCFIKAVYEPSCDRDFEEMLIDVVG